MPPYYFGKRTKNIFDPDSKQPFALSRSRLENFIRCPRCFYLDRRLGVDQPPGFPFTLNSAVDTLLKKEFDIHRKANSQHPLMAAYGIDAVPYQDVRLNEWRDPMRGVQYYHKPTNFIITGGVDDVWLNSEKELCVVDYKATSKEGEVSITAKWQEGYKRQMEIYQWLFRRNGFQVSDIAYFVYVNGRTDRKAFDGKLEFDVTIIPYQGSDSWIEDVIAQAHRCLSSNVIPSPNPECEYCLYRNAAQEVEYSLERE